MALHDVAMSDCSAGYLESFTVSTSCCGPSVIDFKDRLESALLSASPDRPRSSNLEMKDRDSSHSPGNPPVVSNAPSSSPPRFEPPPLPQCIAVPLLNRSIPVAQSDSRSQLTPSNLGSSCFPSPYSAFTELQPRNSRGNSSSSRTSSLPRSSNVSHESEGPGTLPARSNRLSPPEKSSATISVTAVGIGYCATCGQSHDLNAAHRYNYNQSVDVDLCCMLCHQPLVSPLDAKCGHTFCAPCLKNHLTVQALCPVDRKIINYLECQQASKIVKRLLDKLLVACPNTRFCNTVLPRCELEEHLRDWCAGTLVPCDNAHRGCLFAGARVLYLQHRWKCPYALSLPTVANSSPLTQRSLDRAPTNPRGRAPGEISPRNPSQASPNQHRALAKGDLKAPLSDIDETYDSPTILEGKPVSIVIRRKEPRMDWGFTFVGGIDTPLACILIQEVYLDGAVANDARLRPGDQILEVDGRPLISASHAEARQQLSTGAASMQLVIYREAFKWNATRDTTSQPEEELFHVKLCKQRSKLLGIKLVGKKHLPGLYVLELVAGCEAQLDGRLRKDDRILEINGVDLTEGTQEQAAAIINSSSDFVEFKVRRHLRADTPDIVRITSHSSESTSLSRAVQSYSKTNTTTVTRNGSLNRCKAALPKLRKWESDDPVRRDSTQLPSPTTATSSGLTETSSLNVYQASSSETDAVSDTALHVTSESQEQFINGFTSASDSPELKTVDYPTQSTKSLYRERIVVVEKNSEEPLGISVAGGRNSQRGDTPIYVTNIRDQSVLGRNKMVKRGDVLLEVNNTGLVGLTHQEAVSVLRSVSSSCARVHIRLIDSPETSNGPENFLPSWTFWMQLPATCQLTRLIHLRRGNSDNRAAEPLGFSILGGKEPDSARLIEPAKTCGYSSYYPNPIIVKSIVPGLLAHRDGRLKCGDLILAVNNYSMLDISHTDAVRLLKNLESDVELRIISWPGTII